MNEKIEQEKIKRLFPKKNINTDFNKEQGIKGIIQEIKNSTRYDGYIWLCVAIISLVSAILFFYGGANRGDEKLTMGRVIGDYVITNQSGPKPFIVSLKEVSTGKEFNDIEIAKDCRLYNQKSYIGENMKIIKFTIVNVNNENDVEYFFKGINERVCEGQSFTPDSTNSFHIN